MGSGVNSVFAQRLQPQNKTINLKGYPAGTQMEVPINMKLK